MNSLEEKTEAWIKSQSWLTSEHDMWTTALVMSAAAWDASNQASMLAEYRKTLTMLLAMKPVVEDDDVIDADLMPL